MEATVSRIRRARYRQEEATQCRHPLRWMSQVGAAAAKECDKKREKPAPSRAWTGEQTLSRADAPAAGAHGGNGARLRPPARRAAVARIRILAGGFSRADHPCERADWGSAHRRRRRRRPGRSCRTPIRGGLRGQTHVRTQAEKGNRWVLAHPRGISQSMTN